MGSVLSKHEKHVPVDPLLLEVSDVMATSLDLDTTLRRVAEVVRKVIDYEIFAILLLNEKTQECAFAFRWAILRSSPSARESRSARA